MIAVRDLTSPVFQLPMPFVLVSDPIGLALKRLGFTAIGKGASERLYILVHVFGPVGWFIEFLDLKAQWALKLCGETLNGR